MSERSYLLPTGDFSSDELECMLVYYPASDEFRQALMGSLDYLGTWLAWERDTAKRGKIAAALWKAANDCTRECLEMGCLDQLTTDVGAILALLQSTDFCCSGTTTINPPPGQETEITPQEGDPPDYYGETAITDWDDWSEHVCYNANRWVDDLVATAETWNSLSSNGLLTLTVIAAGLALLSFTGIGIPIAISLAVAVLTAATAGGSLIYSTTAQDLEDARDELVCSLINGGNVENVVRQALGEASLDWTSTFQYIDYDSLTAIIYEGGAEGEYLPADTDSSCVCDEDFYDVPTNYLIERTADNGAWYGTTGVTMSDHVFTLTDYSGTGGWGWHLTVPAPSGYTLCGYIIERAGLPTGATWIANPDNCATNCIKVGDTVVPDGFTIGFTSAQFATDKAAFADWISARSAHCETSADACASAVNVALKSEYGTQSGTFKVWHIYRSD